MKTIKFFLGLIFAIIGSNTLVALGAFFGYEASFFVALLHYTIGILGLLYGYELMKKNDVFNLLGKDD